MSNIDFSWLEFEPRSPEEEAKEIVRKAERDALSIIRADYQWIVCCQQMSEKELQQVIDEGPWNDESVRKSFEENHMSAEGFSLPALLDEESKEHYLKRYRQAQIVWEGRGLGKV